MTSMRQELSQLHENSVVEVELTRLRHKAEYVKHTHTHLFGPSKQADRLLFKGIEKEWKHPVRGKLVRLYYSLCISQ